MSQDFGPFSVNPAQVVGLGGALFQHLVSRLIAAEIASAGMAGSDLHTSYQANIGDQGVDAGIYAAIKTDWIPPGNSAWQFKAGNLSPKECADEFEGAARARRIVEKGGKYRIVLGNGLQDYLIASREEELRARATELDYDTSGDNFKIIDGNQLARWVEQYPQLAVSTLLHGIGNVAIAYDKWQQSGTHQLTWVPSADRDELHDTVQAFLANPNRLELRIEGVNGIGKTRGVLESFRGSPFEPLVLYVGDADDLRYPLIDHLTGQGRSAVVVVDECTRKRHNVLAQQLQSGRQIKLITIGERDARVPQSVPIVLSNLPNDVIDKVLTQNKSTLWPEARRVVVAQCAGNVRWAMNVAEFILDDPNINIGDLIDANTLQFLVGDLLSGDDGFLPLSALALFVRYGVDREMQAELEQIGTALGMPLDDLLAANRKLEHLGLVTKHGRYRSVTPQPLAIYLATQAWDQLGDKILADLLPAVSDTLAEQLFLRAADLGSSGPAAQALNRILGADGPFRSLEYIAEHGRSTLLIQLAIITPKEMAIHLTHLIEMVTDNELRSFKSIRRDLVWTLEKLVWHSGTFERAADMLLHLALAENETWSNNSTGTWLNLFAPMLPATAATPSARMRYLERVASHSDFAVRKMAAHAAEKAIDVRGGFVVVSGELQGAVVVEPRGTPDTSEAVWEYVRSGIRLLQSMASDANETVRQVAEKSLVDAIHPMLEIEAVRDALFNALATLPNDALRKTRMAIQNLYALFTTVEKPEFNASTTFKPNIAIRRAGLDILVGRLPSAAPIDELTSLAYAKRWEWEAGELQESIERVATSMPHEEALISLVKLLNAEEIPESSFELGAALYAMVVSDEALAAIAALADRGNMAGLVGYLHAGVEDGHSDAFDVFLDGPLGRDLEPATRLGLTVRGPQSDTGWSRLIDLLKVLPVHIGAPRLFGWHIEIEESRLIAILDEWLSKIEFQPDYNFAVDVAALMVSGRPDSNLDLEGQIMRLVELRSKFPEVAHQSSDWVQLARRQLANRVDELLLSLLQQVDAGSLHILEGSEEQTLIEDAVLAAGSRSLDTVLQLVHTGSWRIQLDFRGWLADLYLATDIIAWVGTDVGRGRLVAKITGISKGQPSDVVRFLLDKFGTDDEVSSSLYGEFISGAWWGNESDRLNDQITQLEGWAASRDESVGVKSWVRKVIENLRRRRDVALEEEDEEQR